jgi:hypothetical protein
VGDGGQDLEYANPDPPAGKKRKENLMPFPQTLDELRAAGYRFNLDAHCRGCGARIEWWITPGREAHADGRYRFWQSRIPLRNLSEG